jgi:hypothetical protein
MLTPGLVGTFFRRTEGAVGFRTFFTGFLADRRLETTRFFFVFLVDLAGKGFAAGFVPAGSVADESVFVGGFEFGSLLPSVLGDGEGLGVGDLEGEGVGAARFSGVGVGVGDAEGVGVGSGVDTGDVTNGVPVGVAESESVIGIPTKFRLRVSPESIPIIRDGGLNVYPSSTGTIEYPPGINPENEYVPPEEVGADPEVNPFNTITTSTSGLPNPSITVPLIPKVGALVPTKLAAD